jgi:hypothetical protein
VSSFLLTLPHLCQHLLLFVFLMIALLTSERCKLNVVLICVSFIDKDIEYFFMYFLGIWTSFENCSFYLPIYCIVCSLGVWTLYIFCIYLLSDELLAESLFCSVGCLLLMAVFPLLCRSILILCNFICQFLLLFPGQLEIYSESHYQSQYLQLFSPVATSQFQVLH